MLFNSFDFMLFFPAVVIVFLVVPKKLRSLWLLIASYYFYMSWNPKYAVLMVTSTFITFLSGILIEKASSINRKKAVLAFSLIINLGILVLFKYANFALDTLSMLLECAGVETVDRRFDLLLPVGISFYTFQALGYTIDVYRKKIAAERNIINHALFVSFFPQLVAGPIERSGNLLEQIRNVEKIRVFEYDRIRDGVMLIFWGLFQKLVIADRAALLVSQVFDNYWEYGFWELAIAAVLFAFQIYCDFGGYTNIAKGASDVMGFSLMDNFRQPYLASGMKEFWRRWHISLTSWFTDYLYIPLGGSSKGRLRKYFNVFIVFGVSGLWHGASWHFVAWGLIHALFRVVGDIKAEIENKLIKIKASRENSVSRRIRKGIITFVLVDFAWVFFAADSIHMALGIFRQMLNGGVMTTGIFEIGLSKDNWKIMMGSIAVLFTVDVIHENGISVRKWICSQEIWFRLLVYNVLIWSVIMLGIYGVGYDTNQFIYFQF